MKNSYVKPSVEAVELSKKDVIQTSGLDSTLFGLDSFNVGDIDFNNIKDNLA